MSWHLTYSSAFLDSSSREPSLELEICLIELGQSIRMRSYSPHNLENPVKANLQHNKTVNIGETVIFSRAPNATNYNFASRLIKYAGRKLRTTTNDFILTKLKCLCI